MADTLRPTGTSSSSETPATTEQTPAATSVVDLEILVGRAAHEMMRPRIHGVLTPQPKAETPKE